MTFNYHDTRAIKPSHLQSTLSKLTMQHGKNLAKFTAISCGLTLLVGCHEPESNKKRIDAAGSAVASTATAAIQEANQIMIYTSTNVWGALAKSVGGDKVKVISAVNDQSQDPHEYQASANDKLAVSKAQLVLVNGGGYDDWTSSLANSVANKPVIINAVDLSGLKPAGAATDHHANETAGEHAHHADFNEHVFFSLDTAKKVADAVANQLASKDPDNKAKYAQNAANFNKDMDKLKAKAQAIGQGKNLTAFTTEPVTGYLMTEMGIKDITPAGYVEQAETDAGVSVKVLNDSKNLLTSKQANVIVANAQTEDATAKQLMAAAAGASVPLVQVNETFPEGITTYQAFIENTIDKFANALQSAPKP